MNKHFELLDTIFKEPKPLIDRNKKMLRELKKQGLSEEEAVDTHLAWLERNEIVWRKNKKIDFTKIKKGGVKIDEIIKRL